MKFDFRVPKFPLINYYGILLTMPDDFIPPNVSGETLAAKLVFKDRIIKITWDGQINIEPWDW